VQSAVLRSHVVCLSVRLSVCDVGKLWSHRLEFFRNNSTISYLGTFALCNHNMTGSAPRGTPLNLGQKSPTPCWFERRRHSIAAEWSQIAQRSQLRAYRKPPSLFLMVPSLTPYDLPSPQNGGSICPPTYANGHISATGDPIHFMFGSRV